MGVRAPCEECLALSKSDAKRAVKVVVTSQLSRPYLVRIFYLPTTTMLKVPGIIGGRAGRAPGAAGAGAGPNSAVMR